MRDAAYPSPRDLCDPALWERSTQASRARRARAARQRQLSVRARGTGLATLTALAVGTTSAFAASGGASADAGAAPTGAAGTTAPAPAPAPKGGSAQTRAVQRALGLAQTGRTSAKLKRAVRAFQRSHGLTVDGVVGPETLAALGIATTPASTPTAGDVPTKLAAIAQCESGDDPTAVSPDSQYYGKYQFDVPTWKANGGTEPNAAAAPAAEQDQVATRLYQSQGTTPWPVCGKQAA